MTRSTGGRVEPGETPREGARRELFEETGVAADPLPRLPVRATAATASGRSPGWVGGVRCGTGPADRAISGWLPVGSWPVRPRRFRRAVAGRTMGGGVCRTGVRRCPGSGRRPEGERPWS
ncbi:NUDIX domain-containing protein [Streptomyces sp. NPDC000594]|uniref:NUDIX domain-containing protein n=1 Tax=Streptomyces sp. NPDC000594 TaxID=3154261 RepID=UPI0033348304